MNFQAFSEAEVGGKTFRVGAGGGGGVADRPLHQLVSLHDFLFPSWEQGLGPQATLLALSTSCRATLPLSFSASEEPECQQSGIEGRKPDTDENTL